MDTLQKQPFILVLDDSVTVRKIIEVALQREGYYVVSYGDPVEVLQDIQKGKLHPPEMLFVDLVLPKMHGYEVIRHLKEHSQWTNMTVIVVSRCDGFFDRLKARLVGATLFLQKPFTIQQLLTLVQAHMQPSQEI